MAFCKNCGAQINDFYSVCPSCGTADPVENQAAMQSVDMPQQFAQPGYPQQQQFAQPGYPQQQQFAQPGYPQQQQFAQPNYPQQQQFAQPNYPQQQYGQNGFPQQYGQNGYSQQRQYTQAGYYGQFSEDRKANAGEIILAVLFPLIGLILYWS